ncbi:MAG: serine hydrolase domain-containing protein [Micromonosporaceae bacterium]
MPGVDELEMKARAGEILNRWPAVGLAVGVVRDGSLEFFHGHGVADIASNTPVTEDTVFRVGSITKTFTAIAVMQLCEQGRVGLDAPASDYLRGYRLIPAKASFRPATVRHLLTHTAGIAEMLHPAGLLRPLFGETVKAGDPVPSLAAFYRGGLRIQAEPGTRFTYTDHGPATLGQIVQDVSGQPLDRYLREHVFQPLGMTDTSLVRSELDQSRLATGYTLRSGGAKAVTDYEVVTAGAAAAYSTPRDMARYLAALLGGGANQHGSVLQPATLATMFEPHYQPDPRVPGMGLAFFRASADGHPVVEHQGIVPGFNSQILLAPGDGAGVMAFTNGARQAMLWLPGEVAGLLNHLLGVPHEAIRADVPQHPEIWGDICGWYYLPGRLTDARVRGMLGAGAEVFTHRGRLIVRGLTPVPAMYRGFVLHPDDGNDPYVFRIDLSESGLSTVRVVFSQEPGVGTTALHLDLMPVSLHRQPATRNPRLWLTGALGALAVAATATAVRRLSRPRKGCRPPGLS